MLPKYAEIVRIHRTFLYNIDIVYIGELASLPLFHLRYLTFGSSGKETSKLCPFGTKRIGWTPDMVEFDET